MREGDRGGQEHLGYRGLERRHNLFKVSQYVTGQDWQLQSSVEAEWRGGEEGQGRLRGTDLGHVLCDNIEAALLLHNHTQ